jgi:hypothetical protein
MDKVGMHVGHNIDAREHTESLANAIATVFRAGYDNRMDQETIREALQILNRLSTSDIGNLSMSNVNIRND